MKKYKVWKCGYVTTNRIPKNFDEREKLFNNLDKQMRGRGSPKLVLEYLLNFEYMKRISEKFKQMHPPTVGDIAIALQSGRQWIQNTIDFLLKKGLVRSVKFYEIWDIVPSWAKDDKDIINIEEVK